jgi:hypothetical protein
MLWASISWHFFQHCRRYRKPLLIHSYSRCRKGPLATSSEGITWTGHDEYFGFSGMMRGSLILSVYGTGGLRSGRVGEGSWQGVESDFTRFVFSNVDQASYSIYWLTALLPLSVDGIDMESQVFDVAMYHLGIGPIQLIKCDKLWGYCAVDRSEQILFTWIALQIVIFALSTRFIAKSNCNSPLHTFKDTLPPLWVCIDGYS